MHKILPTTVGAIIASAAHFQLSVSCLMVKTVVEQGQCNSEKAIKHSAVVCVHPFCEKSWYITEKSLISLRHPCDKYIIITIGRTISLAGNPRINPVRMAPSIPRNCPAGSRKTTISCKQLSPLYCTFARIHSTIPAGAENTTARRRTNHIFSRTELIKIRLISGFR